MTLAATRRGLLGMTAATLAAPAIVRAADDAVTIAWPSDVPGWDPNQRFTPDAQSLFKAVFDQPLDQDPSLRLVPHLITRWELSADGLTHADRTARRCGVPQRRPDDGGRFQVHLFRPHQIHPGTRHRQFVAQGAGHRDSVVHQGGDALQFAGADRAGVAGIPRQLRGPQSLCRTGGRTDVRAEADRHRPIPAGGMGSERAHRARAQRQLLGTEAGDPARHRADHQGPVGARGSGTVRPGRPRDQPAGARDGAPARRAETCGRARSDHADHPAAGAQRPRLRRHQCAPRRASRDRQGRAVAGVLQQRRGAVVAARNTRHAGLHGGSSTSNTIPNWRSSCWRSRVSARRSR